LLLYYNSLKSQLSQLV